MQISQDPVLFSVAGPSPSSTVVTNAGPSTVYYAATQTAARALNTANSGAGADGSIVPGSTVILPGPKWFICLKLGSATLNVTMVSPVSSSGSAPFIDAAVEYGAAPGNTAAQNVTAIQAALDAVPSAGGSVYLQAGTYSINAAVLLKSNTHLFGDGDGTILSITGNTNGIENKDGATGNINLKVSNLRINGSGLTGSPYQKGIYFDHSDNAAITGVTVYNVYLQGIDLNRCNRGRITNNYVLESWGNGISLDDACQDCVIANNSVIDARDSCVGVHIGTIRTAIIGNTLAHTLAVRLNVNDGGCYGYGIDVYGAPGTVITGNTINNTANHGIYVHPSVEGPFNPDRVIIKGNYIYTPRNRPGPTTPGDSDGIQFFATADDQIHHCIVEGNVVYNPTGNGIYIGNGVVSSTFSGNIVNAAPLTGINVVGSANGLPYRNVLIGNYVRGCGVYGIAISHASSAEHVVTSNYLMGNTAGAIYCPNTANNMIGPNSGSGGASIEILSPVTFGATTASGVPNNSLFTDVANSKLAFKDSTGALTYVESRGLKLPCRVSAPVNVTVASPGATIDGVTMVAADRALLSSQTTASQNGLYVWNGAAVPMTRCTDSDTAAKMTDSLLVTVDEGTVNRDSVFTLSTNKPITLNTTALRFTRVHPAYASASHSSGSAYQPASSQLENLDRTQTALVAQPALATGTARVFPMGIQRAGDTLSTISFHVATAAVTVTNSWAGIARLSDLVILAISPNSTAAPGANAKVTFTFGTPYTASKDETLVGFIMYAATTPPALYGLAHANALTFSELPVVNGTSNTGATTPPAVSATLTAFTAQPQMYYAFCT